MIRRPAGVGRFEFVVASTLRTEQLIKGCTPRVDDLGHKPTVIAQQEVAAGKVALQPSSDATVEVVTPAASEPRS
jgi:DNA-directed RNA polymerase omega subunit